VTEQVSDATENSGSNALRVGVTGKAVSRPIPVAISARHVHLSVATVEHLFGRGRRLTMAKAISQPGQFAAEETVSLLGPAGRIHQVRVVGPERAADQVEISRTDEFLLGVDAPVRESGDLVRTPGLRIEGPVGHIDLEHGVICSLRHIHMCPADAAEFGVGDGDTVDVHVGQAPRTLTFGGVRIRVRPEFRLEMHVDTDEANAAGIAHGSQAVLEAIHRSAPMRAAR